MKDDQILKNSSVFLEESDFRVKGGFLGKFFGDIENALINICGVLIFALLGAGIVFSGLNTETYALNFWVIVSPLITLALGYLFGNRKT